MVPTLGPQVISPSLLPVLSQYWGFRTFRPLQEDAMTAILDGRDSVVVLPTGSGKSLCFQAPALVAPQDPSRRLAVVVSPLIALMKDQVDGLREAGVPARCLNSAQSSGERADAMQAIRSGECRLLYVSPERLVGDGGEAFRRMKKAGFAADVVLTGATVVAQVRRDQPSLLLLDVMGAARAMMRASSRAPKRTLSIRYRRTTAAEASIASITSSSDRASVWMSSRSSGVTNVRLSR